MTAEGPSPSPSGYMVSVISRKRHASSYLHERAWRDTEDTAQATDGDEHVLPMGSHESHLEGEGVVRRKSRTQGDYK